MPRTLADLVQVNPPVPLPAGANASTAVSFVPMSDVTEAGEWSGRQVRPLGKVSSGFTAFADDDVLVAKITPCFENGKGAHVDGLINGIGFGSTEFHVLRARGGTSARFVHHLVQSKRLRSMAEAFMSGSAGQRRVPREFFDVFRVPDLTFDEQVAVSQALDTLDTTIRQTEAIIEKLKHVKQGLLHDLLTRGIAANGELRPPQSQAPHLYKNSPLGWIPREWTLNTGRTVCTEIVVGIVVKPTQYYRSAGVPMLRSANVRETGMTLNDLVFMSPRDHQGQQKSAVRPGDVLTVRTGYPGTSCVVDDRVSEANCIDIIISRPGATLSPKFWAVWINSSFGKEQILRVQGGLAQQHFNVSELAAMKVSTPPLDEQRELVARLTALDDRIASEMRSVSVLRDVKAGLVEDLLTGRVRVDLRQCATSEQHSFQTHHASR